MARRPYINQRIIASELRPGKLMSSRPDGYISGALNKEVIGMDGRNDWFRAECRECGQKHITRRKEKNMHYYACQNCGTWHNQNSGFFNLDRFPTKPLKNAEVDGTLYRVQLDYTVSDFDQTEWHYNTKTELESKVEDDTWEAVSEIEPAP